MCLAKSHFGMSVSGGPKTEDLNTAIGMIYLYLPLLKTQYIKNIKALTLQFYKIVLF